jgi:D-alanyl-D-alanine endopeptidase (penicillin-binding protein 7)
MSAASKKTFFGRGVVFALLMMGGFAVAQPTRAAETLIKQSGYMPFEQWDSLTNATTTVPYVALAVIEYETFTPLHFYAEQRPIPTASLMKLITAGTIVRNPAVNWNDQLSFSWWDNEGDLRKYVGKKDNYVTLKLEPGETVSMRDMFASMLIVSANNAANRLATHTAGSLKNFLAQMRQTATNWGLTHTIIDEPSGLSLKNVSTAQDMALAACHAFHEPQITEFSAKPGYNFSLSSGREKKLLHTVHDLRYSPTRYVGAKTGYLHETKFHVAAGIVTPQGKKLCVAVLTSPTRVISESVVERVATWADLMYQVAPSTIATVN